MQNAGLYLVNLRATAPLVHIITNYVAMNISANVLLAAGASPAMLHAREEVQEFAGIAQALNVNIGTFDPAWAEAMEMAAQVMVTAGRPWVLDPVGIGVSRFRREVCARLLTLRPTVIRGNASEILTLAGAGGAGRGADSADPVAAAEEAAHDLAARSGAVVAVSGPVDYVTDGVQAWRIANGDAMMPRVTALGCSLNALIAGFVVGQPALPATVATLAYFGLAGERAAKGATGPGSFQVGFLDALYSLSPQDVTAGAKVSRA